MIQTIYLIHYIKQGSELGNFPFRLGINAEFLSSMEIDIRMKNICKACH